MIQLDWQTNYQINNYMRAHAVCSYTRELRIFATLESAVVASYSASYVYILA